jgi:hypothetical protein
VVPTYTPPVYRIEGEGTRIALEVREGHPSTKKSKSRPKTKKLFVQDTRMISSRSMHVLMSPTPPHPNTIKRRHTYLGLAGTHD